MQVSNAPVDANAAQDPQVPWSFKEETSPEKGSMMVQKLHLMYTLKDYLFHDQTSIFTYASCSLKS